ncbi:hypothetical protein HOLleu_38660 [Holothuria leucospilota]|uniref:Uncharacterized protein n=1 Tax=Holothuria leucospilota TaxID=206669 RepID=A0A9Q0YM90_HOLLE|nr:hypothetical protein HOLleu_38660 [Holothuria leucospilota]
MVSLITRDSSITKLTHPTSIKLTSSQTTTSKVPEIIINLGDVLVAANWDTARNCPEKEDEKPETSQLPHPQPQLQSNTGTGSDITILRSDIYNNISEDSKPKLKESSDTVATADGQTLTCMGCGNFSLKIACRQIEYKVWVAEIEAEGILGTDLLGDCNSVIHVGNRKVTLRELKGADQKIDEYSQSRVKVKLADNAVVPPNSKAIVRGMLEKRTQGSAIVEMLPKLPKKHDMLMARAVVDVSITAIPVRVFICPISLRHSKKEPFLQRVTQ